MKSSRQTPLASPPADNIECTPKPNPTAADIYRAAKRYVAAGISIIPIAADRQKRPCFPLLPRRTDEKSGQSKATWKPFQTRLPTRSELDGWFKPGQAEILCGIAIVTGSISGGLEVIDFDNATVGFAWYQQIRKEASTLLRRLVLVLSPRPGLHVYYRCAAAGRSTKLARTMVFDVDAQEEKLKVLVETKGEHGYVLAPGSPGECHPSGKPYELLGGRDISQVATITPEERATLFTAAESFNEYTPPARPRPPVRPPGPAKPYAGGRPGDDYNARASWAEILEPHGWQFVQEASDGTQYWCRPGKNYIKVSASVNFGGSGLLYVFSTKADPFEQERGYNKFSAYTVMNYAGDFQAAARALRRMGYGKPITRAIVDPYQCYGQFVPQRGGSSK